ncbi:MAG TPA: hypothetical protein VGA99_01240 [bacterium]
MLYHRIFENVNRQSVKVWVLGFSQGTATVSRWVSRGMADIDHLVLWGGFLPPDLDLAATRNIFHKLGLIFVFGKNDAFTNQEIWKRRAETLAGM